MNVTKIQPNSKMVTLGLKTTEENKEENEIRFTIKVDGDFDIAAEMTKVLVNQLVGQFALSEDEKK